MAMSGRPPRPRVGEQLLHRRGRAQVRLQGHGLRARRLHGRHGGLGVGPGGRAVVVDGHGLGAVLGQVAGDQAAQVLRATGDQHHLAFETVPWDMGTPCWVVMALQLIGLTGKINASENTGLFSDSYQ
jgi:hypothetical protein